MANINIAIPESVHKKLKLKAIQDDRTLKAFVIEVLEQEIP